jgi:hypothetical protein
MEPWLRSLLLSAGLVFCVMFGALTLTVAIDYGFDIFVLASFVILGLIGAGLVGAIRHPDDDE